MDVNDEKNEIVIYDIKSGFEVKDVIFDMVFTDNEFTSIQIKLEGFYVGSYERTKFSGLLDFKLSYKLETNDKANDYSAPRSDKEVDLANS